MKSATIRQVQHNLASVLREVEAGEEIEIRRRGHPIAKIIPIVPSPHLQKVDWSTAMKRLDQIYGGRIVSGKPASELIAEGRGDR